MRKALLRQFDSLVRLDVPCFRSKTRSQVAKGKSRRMSHRAHPTRCLHTPGLVSRGDPARQVRGQLTPVMTAASPAGGVSSGSSSRSSSSGAQRGPPMASRVHGGGWGARSGTLGTRGRSALPSREPGGSYKGEPRGDSRPAARGGHGAGTHPAPHAHTRTCPRAPWAQAPRGQSPPRGAAAFATLPVAFVVSETLLLRCPAFQSSTCSAPTLSEHIICYTDVQRVPTTCRARRTQLPCICTLLFSMSLVSALSVPGTATDSELWWHNLEMIDNKQKHKARSVEELFHVEWKNKAPSTPQIHIPCKVEGLGCPSS